MITFDETVELMRAHYIAKGAIKAAPCKQCYEKATIILSNGLKDLLNKGASLEYLASQFRNN